MRHALRPLISSLLAALALAAIAAPAAADIFVPPPPPITAADRSERITTAGRHLAEMPAMFDRCYERFPARVPNAADAVHVRFELRADGRAYRVRVGANSSRNPALATCLTSALRTFSFGPS